MKQYLTTALVAALVASLVMFLGLSLVGNQSADNSLSATGSSRFPNSGVSARGLRSSTSTSPATPTDGALEVTGNSTLSGTLTVSGESNVANLVSGDADASLPGITINSTTTNGIILTAAQICNNSVLDIKNIAATTGTVTLASSSALTSLCLSAVGDTRHLLIWNATTSASFFTLVAGASSSLVTPVSATSSLDNGEMAALNVYRITSSSQAWVVYEFLQVQ